MQNGILDGAVAYLVGPIDHALDDGIGWRVNIKEMFKERGIRLAVLDPTHKFPGLISEVGIEKQRAQMMKDTQDWEGLRKFVKKIVRADLRMVDISDFIIAYIDVDIHACGTYHEIVLGDTQHKPVLLIIKGGKQRCPSWLFGIIHYQYMFDSVEECINYLDKVNSGDVIMDDKWVLLRDGLRKLETDILK